MKTKLFLICVIVFTLVACAAPPPSATPVPPTATAIPPTSTLTAARVVESEVPATKADDVLGVWLVIYSPNDRFPSAENHWEHRTDGNRIATFTTGAMKGYTTIAKYWFENGLYKIQYPQGSSEANSFAIGAYQVYVTKQGGKAVQLRFVAVDDEYVDRKNRMIYKPWTRVEP